MQEPRKRSRSNAWTRSISAAIAVTIASAASASDRLEDARLEGKQSGAALDAAQTDRASPPSPERRFRLALSTVGYTDTAGVYAFEPRLVAIVPAVLRSELRVGASYADAGLQLAAPRGPGVVTPRTGGDGSGGLTAPGRSMVGASLSVPWSVLRASAGFAVYSDAQSSLQDREIALSVKPVSRLELSAAVRQRPFVAMAEPLAVDDQVFHAAGVGGALDLLAAWPLTVGEVRVTGKAAPTAWSYLYADARLMDVSDGNRGWNAAAGAGVSLTQLFGSSGPVDLTAVWDTWAAAYSEASTVYYSPASVVSHSPGVDLRLRRPAYEIAGEGGVIFAPGQSFTGAYGGASAALHLGRLSIVARAQARSDPWFSSRKAWLTLQTEL